MDHFNYIDGQAHCEDISLDKLAEELGTPLYVYSRATLKRHCKALVDAFSSYPTLPCFAVKANSNLRFLKEIFSSGFGADLVSGGELARSLLGGVAAKDIVFSGVGKQADEIRQAVDAGIGSFNVESLWEIELIGEVAKSLNKTANLSLRINPNIDAKTNPKIATGLYSTKFGLMEEDAFALLPLIKEHSHLQLNGLACHIGSQITDLKPLTQAAARMASLSQEVQSAGHTLTSVNMGGGLGIRYRDELPPALGDYAKAVIEQISPTGLKLIIEPGRVVAGNTGIIVTRVLGVKKTPAKSFVIVDAAMNDLMRPTLYGSFHEILPVKETSNAEEIPCDVVGPICESGDYLGQDRTMTKPDPGDLLYVRGTGAYASTMASNYNSRPRSAEVMVDGSSFVVTRPREKLETLWQSELEALEK